MCFPYRFRLRAPHPSPLPTRGRGLRRCALNQMHHCGRCPSSMCDPVAQGGRDVAANGECIAPLPVGYCMHTSYLTPVAARGEPEVWSLWHGASAPSPSWGGVRGGGKAFPAGRVFIDFIQPHPPMPLQVSICLPYRFRLRAPHPSPLPTRGRGAERPCHRSGASLRAVSEPDV